MNTINVKYFYDLGRVMEALYDIMIEDDPLVGAEWADVSDAKTWLESLVRYEILPRTCVVAREIIELLKGLLSRSGKALEVPLSDDERLHLSQLIIKFTNVLESETPELYAIVARQVGLYSLRQIMEDATCHLSRKAQAVMSDRQKDDFKQAGICLALDLYTACGFHAMRALEEEARVYHKLVTGVDLADAPLGAIINGDNRVKGSGLKEQFIKEGSKNDSPLGLIIATLSHVNKIYRCPVTHPDMVLDYDTAKQVFDLAANVISEISGDGIDRFNAQRAKASNP